MVLFIREEREKEGFRKRSSPLFEFFGIEKISWIGEEGGKKMESSEDATVASFE